jgi:nitric oxide reductase NorE protein
MREPITSEETFKAQRSPSPHIPGELGIWILIFGDLFVFAVFFATFAYYRLTEPVVFRSSQAALNQPLALLNTVVLLTSSLFVVRALEAGRRAARCAARSWTLSAIVCGLSFVVIKAVEYGQKISDQLYPTTNNFFMLYFALTGIHLFHVLVGLGVLSFLRARFNRTAAGRDLIAEGCAIYWHMVDILWVVLFAIFYLHR